MILYHKAKAIKIDPPPGRNPGKSLITLDLYEFVENETTTIRIIVVETKHTIEETDSWVFETKAVPIEDEYGTRWANRTEAIDQAVQYSGKILEEFESQASRFWQNYWETGRE